MEKLDKIVGFLPAFTAAAVVAAIFYNFGFIYPFGTEWIAALTVKDLLALTWSSFPMVAIGAVFGATVSSTTHNPTVVVAATSNRILAANRWYSLVFVIFRTLYIIGAVSLPVWAGMYLTFHPVTSYSDIIRVLVLFVIIHLSGVAVLFRTSNADDQERTRFPSMIYHYMVLTLAIGALNGYSRALATPKYQVTESNDQKWCATLVHLADRGPLLFDPVTSEVSLLRWDTIKSISKKKACSTEREAKSPPKATETKASALKGPPATD
jgi:hypothetical protein